MTPRSTTPFWRDQFAFSEGRIPSLEGLRALAVFLVFWVHYHADFGSKLDPASPLWRWSFLGHGWGNYGVDLFFVISGYLIYGAILRRRGPLHPYLLRRVRRIYPTYLATVALQIALLAVVPGSLWASDKLGHGWWGNLKYLAPNLVLVYGIFPADPFVTVAWSLSYEFAFYLVVPTLVVLLGCRQWRRTARVGFLLAALSLLMLAGLAGRPLIPMRMLMFGVGMLLHEFADARRGAAVGRAGEFAVIALFLPALLLVGAQDRGYVHFSAYWALTLMGLLFFLLCACAITTTGILSRIFAWPFLRFVGNISYSYYLVNGLLMHALSVPLKLLLGGRYLSEAGYFALLPVCIAVSTLGSSLLYLAVEKPFSLDPETPLTRWSAILRARRQESAGSARRTVALGEPAP